MACLRIRYGRAEDCLLRQPAAGFLDDRLGRVSRFNNLHSLSIPNLAVKLPFSRISTAATGTVTAVGVSDRSVSWSALSVFGWNDTSSAATADTKLRSGRRKIISVARTRVLKNSKNPKWDEHFIIPLAHALVHLEFQVKDDDVLVLI
ncbi:hypothetical protein L1887_08057 [Cichorium endivia]|nr:hypothetical protein L1887_08057 [Cichorium endivia]